MSLSKMAAIAIIAVVILAGGAYYGYAQLEKPLPRTSSFTSSDATTTENLALAPANTASTTGTTSSDAVCESAITTAFQAAEASKYTNETSRLDASIGSRYAEGGGTPFGFILGGGKTVYVYIDHPQNVYPSSSSISIYSATSSELLGQTVRPMLRLQNIPNSVGSDMKSLNLVGDLLVYDLQNNSGVDTAYAIRASTGSPVWSRSNTAIVSASTTGIYADSTDSAGNNVLIRLSADTGIPLWMWKTPARESFAGSSNGEVYLLVNSSNADPLQTALYQVDSQTGKTLWVHDLGDAIANLFAFTGSKAYFNWFPNVGRGGYSSDRRVLILDETTGQQLALLPLIGDGGYIYTAMDLDSLMHVGAGMPAATVCGGYLYFVNSGVNSTAGWFDELYRINTSTNIMTPLATSSPELQG